MANPALLIIDIQNDYFPGGNLPLVEPEHALHQASRLLERFRERDWPRIHVQHESVRPGAGFMMPNTPGQEIHPRLTPMADERVIVKNFPNAFQQTPLHETLQEMGIEQLVICGMMTHMCIDTSVRAAFERGYGVQLIGDATATRSLHYGDREVAAELVQAAFLAALDGLFAKVVTAEEWLAG